MGQARSRTEAQSLQEEIASQRRWRRQAGLPPKDQQFSESKLSSVKIDTSVLQAELKDATVTADEKKAILSSVERLNREIKALNQNYHKNLMEGHEVSETKLNEEITRLKTEFVRDLKPIKDRVTAAAPVDNAERKALEKFEGAATKVFDDFPKLHEQEIKRLHGKAADDKLTAFSDLMAEKNSYLGLDWYKMIPIALGDVEEKQLREAERKEEEEAGAAIAAGDENSAAYKALERFRKNKNKPAKFQVDGEPPYWIVRKKNEKGEMVYQASHPDGINEKNFDKVAKKLLQLNGLAEGTGVIELDFNSPQTPDQARRQSLKIQKYLKMASESNPPIKIVLGPGAEESIMMCGDARPSGWQSIAKAALLSTVGLPFLPASLAVGAAYSALHTGSTGFVKGSAQLLRDSINKDYENNHKKVAEHWQKEFKEEKEMSVESAKEQVRQKTGEIKSIADAKTLLPDRAQPYLANVDGHDAKRDLRALHEIVANDPTHTATDMSKIQEEVKRIEKNSTDLREIQNELQREVMRIDKLIENDPNDPTIQERVDALRNAEAKLSEQLIRLDQQRQRLDGPTGLLAQMIAGAPADIPQPGQLAIAAKIDPDLATLRESQRKMEAVRVEARNLFGRDIAPGARSTLSERIEERDPARRAALRGGGPLVP